MDWDGPVSLLAPLVAIGAAMLSHRVLPSLLAGAAIGALVGARGDVVAALRALGGYGWGAVFDWDHLRITLFSLGVGATVAVMQASGGTPALVGLVDHLARGRRGAMVASWAAGLIVFFDDYANCLVVGSAMGPVCDRAGVSRAKLAYIVDATAAPVASLAVVSTWVGYETGLIAEALASVGRNPDSAFALLVESLPYRFYSLVTIGFVAAVALTGRDHGPMLEAEVRAWRARGDAAPPPDVDHRRWWLAGLPVAALVGVTFGVMLYDGTSALETSGGEASLSAILGAADPYGAMLTGAGCGLGLAVAGARAVGVPFGALGAAAGAAVRAVLAALGVLYCAWILGDAVRDAHAAAYLSSLLATSLPPALLPAATYVLACAISFATGTSFGTMAILTPLAVPLAATVDGGAGYVLAGTTGAVLAGSCMGDHCSPISDTTVLSALGSGVDLLTHARTQLPYAVAAGVIALLAGHVPAGYGVSPWLCLAVATVVSFGWVYVRGVRPEDVSG